MAPYFLSVDLDGTLTNSEALISQYSIQTITEFINKDPQNVFLLNSGRPMGHMMRFLEWLLQPIETANQKNIFACSDNGCWLIDYKKNDLFKDIFDPVLIRKLWKDAISKKLNPVAHIGNITYVGRITEGTKKLMKRHSAIMSCNIPPKVVDNIDEVDNIELSKFTLLVEENKMKKVAEAFIETNAIINNKRHVSSEGRFFMIMASNRTKASPIEFIKELRGIKRKDIFIFGDSDNDLPAFTVSTNIVVPASASLNIRKKAKFIAGDSTKEGVANFIKKTFL